MNQGVNRRRFLAAALGAGAALAGSHLISAPAWAKELAPLVPIPDQPVTPEDWQALREMAAAVFQANEVTVAGGTFHMPSRDLYISLFAWDSGWHAIGMSRLDPQLAASELELLLNQQCADGHVPHETLFKEIKIKPSFKRVITEAAVYRQYDRQGRSAFIDPPSFLVAAEKVYAQTQDRAWLERLLPRMERCAYYLTRDRDLFGDGLVSIIHPWESGTDSSPVFDQPLHLNFNNFFSAMSRAWLYPHLLNQCAKRDWDLERIAKANYFVFEDLTTNAITIRGLVSIANLNQALGRADKAKALRDQARAMTETLTRINWDETDGCYWSRWDRQAPKLAKRTTCASLLPLFTGLISKEQAERIVREHLLNPAEFWLPYVLCFNAKDELDQEKIAMADLMLWRGYCIWTNMNWMMNEGLLAYGYRDEARELTRRTAKMIRREGFREFYDCRTGRGGGITTFNWPALVLDMIATAWPEVMA